MDNKEFIKDIEQQLEWFCNKITEPVPINPKDQDKIFERMVQVGWIRQVEVDTYKEMTRNDDE